MIQTPQKFTSYHVAVSRSETIVPVTTVTTFQLLHQVALNGLYAWSSARTADHLDSSFQVLTVWKLGVVEETVPQSADLPSSEGEQTDETEHAELRDEAEGKAHRGDDADEHPGNSSD